MHASNDVLRDEIVPINKKYPIEKLLNACQDYLGKENKRKQVTIEYILIKNVNDSLEDAKGLVKLLSKLPCKINLIPFNPLMVLIMKDHARKYDINFKSFLINKGFIATLRTTRGDGVDAACGQLVGNLTKSIKGKKLISHKTI